MKKHSKILAIFTYIFIVFFVVGINVLIASPINQLKESAVSLQENFQNKISEIEINENQQNIIDMYSGYNMEVGEHYKSFGRIFINMILALLVIDSLALVIFGLSKRVNTNRNKSIYNAITLAGITCIFYLIWFVINFSNSFELLF